MKWGNIEADKDDIMNKSNSKDGGAVTCDGCGYMMSDSSGTTWYTCMEYVNISMCWLCSKNCIHGHHKQ